MDRLSRRQEQILSFIRKRVRERGYPPSVREIGEAVGLASSSTVHGHLARLEAKGYLRRDPTKPRAIELLEDSTPRVQTSSTRHTRDEENWPQPEPYVLAPVVGKVTAGLPITAVEHTESYFPLPASLTRGDDAFLLRVQGDSMIEAGILDGDFVIVRKQDTAVNGEIVVALTEDDEATVKRFFKEADHVRLQPENAAMEPIRLRHVRILGKVIGVFRNLS
ncbi:MAG: transcriptional repressor LexA [Alicyclobacillus sp.]|nr:transcriptional repressor LexA [Alicyclobacillus sp.]